MIIAEQRKYLKYLYSSFIILGIYTCGILVLNNEGKEFSLGDAYLIVVVFIMVFLVFILWPIKKLRLKKQLIIKKNSLRIKSNRTTKLDTNIDLNKMFWWKIIDPVYGLEGGMGQKILIKTSNKKVMIDEMEFNKFYEILDYFEKKYESKKK